MTEKSLTPHHDALLALLALLNNDVGTALHHLGQLDLGQLVKIASAGALLANLALREAVDGPKRPPSA